MQAVESYADAKILRWGLSSVLACILRHLSWSSYVWRIPSTSISQMLSSVAYGAFKSKPSRLASPLLSSTPLSLRLSNVTIHLVRKCAAGVVLYSLSSQDFATLQALSAHAALQLHSSTILQFSRSSSSTVSFYMPSSSAERNLGVS